VGVVLALGSTVIWALFWIFNTRATGDPVANLLSNFLFSLPAVGVATWWLSDFSVPGWPGLLGAVYVGTFEMGVAFVLWLQALRSADNTARIANLIFLSPFLSLVFIHFLVGEEIYLSTGVGLVLIVLGNVIQQRAGR